jgi:MYXO-CTERM domain-containing protein
VAGLDWVYENLSTLKVRVMNLSICSTQLYNDGASCDLGQPALAAAVKNLVDAGVVIFSASGNQGSPTQTSAPACNTGVIAVGATYDSDVGHQPPGATTYAARWGSEFANCGDGTTAFDQITCFTNSNRRLDLVAPGAPMLSDSLNNLTETYWGTSQASPVGAGVAALMLECDPSLTPPEIKSAMTSTGVPRMDPKNGLTFPSLRALDVVRSVCFKSDGGAGQGGAAGAGGAAPASGGSSGAGGVTPGGAAGAPSGGTTSGGGTGGTGLGAGGVSAGGAGGAPATTGMAGSVTGASGASGAMGAGSPFAGAPAAFGGQGGGAMAVGSSSASAGCNCAVPRSGSGSTANFVGVAVLALGALFRRRRSVFRTDERR